MNEYIAEISRRIDCIDATLKKLETRFNQPPQITVEITAISAELLADDIKVLYNNFGATTNLIINAKIG